MTYAVVERHTDPETLAMADRRIVHAVSGADALRLVRCLAALQPQNPEVEYHAIASRDWLVGGA